MLKSTFLILLLTLCCRGISFASQGMPIIAFLGVPDTKTSDVNFRDFRDCGFDVSLYGYPSLRQLIEACRVAGRNGVKILGHCPETHDNPEYAARLLKNEPGFYGYVLQDEPSAERIKELEKEIRHLKAIDKSHCFYINLHPYYADWTLLHTKTKTYEDYLRIASATSCRQISFDFYPVTHNGLRGEWYRNIEMVRAESLRSGKPFWGFILSVPHGEYPQPTQASLRLQAYVNLAYGAQAIQYFTYWTPPITREWDFHDGPISQDGRKTATYYLVQKMNRELRPIADLFYGAKVTAVNHLAKLPPHTQALRTVPTNILRLSVESQRGALVSQFKKNGHHYMAVVNKDHAHPMTLYIQGKKGVCHLQKNLTPTPLAASYRVEAGDIILFRLK